MNIRAIPLSRQEIRKLTILLRKSFGLEKQLYFPVVKFIEWVLGDPRNDFDYIIVSEDEMQDTYGTTNTINNIIKIREDVYNGACQGIPRHRFTLCHELGHFILHQPKYVSHARGNIPIYCQPEWQANTFAAELMAPFDLVKNMTSGEISEKCGISKEAAEIQFKNYHNI